MLSGIESSSSAVTSHRQTIARVESPACVDINNAGSVELQRIIHIGPKRAQQIIALRRAKPFRSVDDLVRVKGIAAKRLADIKKQGVACVSV